ncbi:MAG: glycine/sarcosine/betaine reductase complex component C subunit beta [Treponema sp.]
MKNAVIKGASYILAHSPDLLKRCGSTQSAARLKDPTDPYLAAVSAHLRSFEQAVSYPPNQVYIGNKKPEELSGIPEPWFEGTENACRFGPFGEIMTQKEFYILMKYADSFDLVYLTEVFTEEAAALIKAHPVMKDKVPSLGEGRSQQEIEALIASGAAEGLYDNDVLLGCVKQAHETDPNLNAHIMLENLAVKASGILSAWYVTACEGIYAEGIDYIIECSEEAAGDVNQRGGGNIAKALGEKAGCPNASGCDIRGFCAAPVHAAVNAAALVRAGIFKQVLVVAGGSVPKLGMNGKDHVKKDMPLLEDMIAGFALVIGEDDGVNPVINTEVIGKHAISSGSSPQAVMTALIYDPLQRAGMKITEVEKYSAELQNHEITAPAGAGNVPESNTKMIGALAVMKGQLERSQLPDFVKRYGVEGFAPTQGHIPSGVPFIGHARRDMLEGTLRRAMIIGKGSLFLGRLTNLFDGLSFLLEANKGTGSSGDLAEVKAGGAEIKKIVADAMREVAARILAEGGTE